ncbi:MAG: fasciclin domain-containing protein [Melioribacteraceae bacterium]
MKNKINMLGKINSLKLFLLTVFVFALYSCGSETNEAVKSVVKKDNSVHKGQAHVQLSEGEQPNALQVAMTYEDEKGNKPFSTLVAAVQAAGVEDAVANAGPLTVFAPVNSAFAKIQDAVDNLLKPENKETLAFVLVNHVAPANYSIKQLKKEAKKGRKLYMASGKYLTVENKDGKIFVDGKEILMTVKVSNGWIHVIGDVMVPAE